MQELLKKNPELLNTPGGKALDAISKQTQKELNPAKKRLLEAHLQRVLQRSANTFAVEFSETPATGTAANASSGTGTPGQQVIPGTNTPVPGNIKITPNFDRARTKDGY